MLWEAVITALVAGFAPWTLLIVAGLLRRERPLHHAMAFLASAVVTSLLVGFVVVEAIGAAGAENTHRHRTLSPAIDLGLGLAILLCVPWLARRARQGPKPRKPKKKREPGASRRPWDRWRKERAGLVTAVALGAYAGSPSPLYLAALHSITKGQPDSAVGTFEVLLIAALFLLMAEVPIILFAVRPEQTAASLEAANAWLGRHGRVLTVLAAAGVGLYFTINGLVHLT